MGQFRLFLAIAVLISHLGLPAPTLLVPGPVAVQIFYVVSGFYMGLVLNERYDRPALNRVFYANRVARIDPVYLAFLALHLAVFCAVQWSGGESPLGPYLQTTVSPLEKLFLALLNLTVVGQDIPFFLSVRHGHLAYSDDPFRQNGMEVFHFMAIPMAGSLALEIYFYALAPFIVRRPVRQIAAIAALSFAARVAAAIVGATADPLSYRFFPFELSTFLLGVLAYKAWAFSPTSWRDKRAAVPALAGVTAIVFYPRLLGGWSDQAFFAPRPDRHAGSVRLRLAHHARMEPKLALGPQDRRALVSHVLGSSAHHRPRPEHREPRGHTHAPSAAGDIDHLAALLGRGALFGERHRALATKRRRACRSGRGAERDLSEDRSGSLGQPQPPFHLPACQGSVAA